jgi:predicted nucleic acid-binding protein
MSPAGMRVPRAETLADVFLFDTSVYIAYIRGKEHSDLVDRATEDGRVVLSSVVAMELYAGARSVAEKRLLDRFVESMKMLSAYEVPRENDWARGGILVERFTRFRGHARVRDHFRDILVVLAAVNRGAVLISSNAHIASWGKILKRQGDTLRWKIL